MVPKLLLSNRQKAVAPLFLPPLFSLAVYAQLQYPLSTNSAYSNPGYRSSAYLAYSPYQSNSFYGKPSYAYISPYTGYGGLSGYEGPPYGQNTYWQPGVAYPPSYGSYGAYGSYGGGGHLPPYGNMGSSSFGPSSSTPFYGSSSSHRYHPPSASPLLTSTGTFAPQYSPFFGTYGGIGDYGPPFACRDSHIYGCQQWAAQGLCQQVPEYMLNYCRASCGTCAGGQYGGGFGSFGGQNGAGFGFPNAGFGGGIGTDFPQSAPFASGISPLSSLGYTTDLFGGGGDVFGMPPPLSAFSGGAVPPSSALFSSLYSPYSGFNSPFLAANEHKEKQQKAAKVLFSEDESNGAIGRSGDDLTSAWTLGMRQPSLAGGGTSPIFDQQSLLNSQMSSSPLGLNWPPSSLSTQHSSVSKMVRMDDLFNSAADKAEKSKKS